MSDEANGASRAGEAGGVGQPTAAPEEPGAGRPTDPAESQRLLVRSLTARQRLARHVYRRFGWQPDPAGGPSGGSAFGPALPPIVAAPRIPARSPFMSVVDAADRLQRGHPNMTPDRTRVEQSGGNWAPEELFWWHRLSPAARMLGRRHDAPPPVRAHVPPPEPPEFPVVRPDPPPSGPDDTGLGPVTPDALVAAAEPPAMVDAPPFGPTPDTEDPAAQGSSPTALPQARTAPAAPEALDARLSPPSPPVPPAALPLSEPATVPPAVVEVPRPAVAPEAVSLAVDEPVDTPPTPALEAPTPQANPPEPGGVLTPPLAPTSTLAPSTSPVLAIAGAITSLWQRLPFVTAPHGPRATRSEATTEPPTAVPPTIPTAVRNAPTTDLPATVRDVTTPTSGANRPPETSPPLESPVVTHSTTPIEAIQPGAPMPAAAPAPAPDVPALTSVPEDPREAPAPPALITAPPSAQLDTSRAPVAAQSPTFPQTPPLPAPIAPARATPEAQSPLAAVPADSAPQHQSAGPATPPQGEPSETVSAEPEPAPPISRWSDLWFLPALAETAIWAPGTPLLDQVETLRAEQSLPTSTDSTRSPSEPGPEEARDEATLVVLPDQLAASPEPIDLTHASLHRAPAPQPSLAEGDAPAVSTFSTLAAATRVPGAVIRSAAPERTELAATTELPAAPSRPAGATPLVLLGQFLGDAWQQLRLVVAPGNTPTSPRGRASASPNTASIAPTSAASTVGTAAVQGTSHSATVPLTPAVTSTPPAATPPAPAVLPPSPPTPWRTIPGDATPSSALIAPLATQLALQHAPSGGAEWGTIPTVGHVVRRHRADLDASQPPSSLYPGASPIQRPYTDSLGPATVSDLYWPPITPDALGDEALAQLIMSLPPAMASHAISAGLLEAPPEVPTTPPHASAPSWGDAPEPISPAPRVGLDMVFAPSLVRRPANSASTPTAAAASGTTSRPPSQPTIGTDGSIGSGGDSSSHSDNASTAGSSPARVAGISRAALNRAPEDSYASDAQTPDAPDSPFTPYDEPTADDAPAEEPDLDRLADEVFDILRWRLLSERERSFR